MGTFDRMMVNRNELRFNGKLYRKGDPISVQEIKEVAQRTGVDKLGTLTRTRTIVEPPDKPLDSLTKDQLIDHARELGADFQSSWKKADIRKAIEEVKHG